MSNLLNFTNEVHDWVYAVQDQINSDDFEKRFDAFLYIQIDKNVKPRMVMQ